VRTEKQAKQESKKWGGSRGKGTRRGHKKDGDEENEDFDELADEPVSQSRGQSPLHSVRWERIILDEVIYVPVMLNFNVFSRIIYSCIWKIS